MVEMPQLNSQHNRLKQTKISCFKKLEMENKTVPVWGLAPVGG
jgi:hypothetical protein